MGSSLPHAFPLPASHACLPPPRPAALTAAINRNKRTLLPAHAERNDWLRPKHPEPMRIEIKVPEVGESITEVEIGGWSKKPGEPVRKDEPIVILESEKATVELAAPESGTLSQSLKQKGEVAKGGEVIAYLETDGQGPTATPAKKT